MRKNLMRNCAAILAASAIMVASPTVAQKKQKTVPPASYLEEGGAVGCFSPALTGRARAVAERLGGVPCEAEQAPKPVPQNITKAWLVGVWVSAAQCAGAEFPVRLRKDGSYERLSDAGTWTFAHSAITFTYRDTSVAGDEFVTADMERALPIASNTIKVRRLADDRMMFGSYALRRCSTNPDADLAGS